MENQKGEEEKNLNIWPSLVEIKVDDQQRLHELWLGKGSSPRKVKRGQKTKVNAILGSKTARTLKGKRGGDVARLREGWQEERKGHEGEEIIQTPVSGASFFREQSQNKEKSARTIKGGGEGVEGEK